MKNKTRRGISVKQLNNAKPKTVKIPWFDFDSPEAEQEWKDLEEDDKDYVNVTYSREKYTPVLERSMREKIERGLPGNMLANMLSKLLLDWDVFHYNENEDDDRPLVLSPREGYDEPELIFQVGDKIPINARTLDQMVNIAAQAKIVEGISDDNRPNVTKSSSSDNTF